MKQRITERSFNKEWLETISKTFNDNLGNYGRDKLKVVLEQEYALKHIL